MTTKRTLIVKALAEKLKGITKEAGYETNLYGNVKERLIFPSDDPELPMVCLSSGSETITYQPGNFQDRYLQVLIRFYVESQDDVILAQENIIKDIEKVVEDNSKLSLGDSTSVRDIKIQLIDTDQGVLHPLGTGEIQLVVEY